MNKIVMSFLVLFLFVILITIGVSNYNTRTVLDDDKQSFSFLNQFPYEMQDNVTMKLNFLVRVIASLFGAFVACYGFYFFLIDGSYHKTLPEYISSCLFLIIGISIFLQFVISLKNYNLHLICSSLCFSFTVINYVICGIFILNEDRYSNALAYILFVVAFVLLVLLLVTPLKRWGYLEKEEVDGTVRYYRKKLSILPFMEWIFILSNVLLILMLGIF